MATFVSVACFFFCLPTTTASAVSSIGESTGSGAGAGGGEGLDPKTHGRCILFFPYTSMN